MRCLVLRSDVIQGNFLAGAFSAPHVTGTNSMSDETDIESLSFEEAMTLLEKTVDRLESGDVPLDESIRLFEYGSRLKSRCETTLKAAQEKIQQITLDSSGAPSGVVSRGDESDASL